ncbi:MAG TPA: lysine--tRNA ligase, partial [Clostridiaceae bacterium]|nr:lysine--tRNA ligase [Clostridiaceae bacterium]
SKICQELYGTTKIVYQGTEIDFKPPWRRLTMTEAVKQYANIDFDKIESDDEARDIAKKLNINIKKQLKDCTKGDILNALFEEYGEKNLIQPTLLIDYPVEISP